MDDSKKQILDLLKELHPEIADIETKTDLVTSGALNSLDIVEIIGELSDTFDIEIPPSEITYANFDSLDGLAKMVARLSD